MAPHCRSVASSNRHLALVRGLLWHLKKRASMSNIPSSKLRTATILCDFVALHDVSGQAEQPTSSLSAPTPSPFEPPQPQSNQDGVSGVSWSCCDQLQAGNVNAPSLFFHTEANRQDGARTWSRVAGSPQQPFRSPTPNKPPHSGRKSEDPKQHRS